MKHIKLFEDFMNEGFNDKSILKAFFMAGGPGSGKSYVATELFGFPKGAATSISYDTGLKNVNSDSAFEKYAKDAGIDLSKMKDIKQDSEEWDKLMDVRDRAKKVSRGLRDNYLKGRLGMVIDGTGKNFDKMEKQRNILSDALGYDCYMIFVNTSLEVALERNLARERKLDTKMVEKMWKEVQDNLGRFQKLFGVNRMFVIDNSSYENEDTLKEIEKLIRRELKKPIMNPTGKMWLRMNDPKNKDKNKPF
jgi:cytidylate kinase